MQTSKKSSSGLNWATELRGDEEDDEEDDEELARAVRNGKDEGEDEGDATGETGGGGGAAPRLGKPPARGDPEASKPSTSYLPHPPKKET